MSITTSTNHAPGITQKHEEEVSSAETSTMVLGGELRTKVHSEEEKTKSVCEGEPAKIKVEIKNEPVEHCTCNEFHNGLFFKKESLLETESMKRGIKTESLNAGCSHVGSEAHCNPVTSKITTNCSYDSPIAQNKTKPTDCPNQADKSPGGFSKDSFQSVEIGASVQENKNSDQNKKIAKKFRATSNSLDEKRFQCPDCSYAAFYKSRLLLHQRKHTGEKPFKCLHPRCEFAAAHRSALQKHQRIHTGEKPYKCSYCYYEATRAWSLTVHLRTSHPKKHCSKSTCSTAEKSTQTDTCSTERSSHVIGI